MAGNIQLANGAHAGGPVWVLGFEGPEVVRPDQSSGCFSHGRDIQVGFVLPGVAIQERMPRPGVVDHIAVPLAECRVVRMEFFSDLVGLDDHDVVGKEMLQAREDVAAGDVRVGGEVGDLANRVYARVGTAGGGDPRGCAGQFLDRRLKTRLHTRTVGLHLPADISGPIVGQPQADVAHGGVSPGLSRGPASAANGPASWTPDRDHPSPGCSGSPQRWLFPARRISIRRSMRGFPGTVPTSNRPV